MTRESEQDKDAVAGKGPARVLVVDPQPIVAAGVETLLGGASCFRFAGRAADFREAGDRLRATGPAVLVSEFAIEGQEILPHLPGLRQAGARGILLFAPRLPLRMLQLAIREGILGYVAKTEPLDLLLPALERVSRGKLFLGPDLSEQLLRFRLQVETVRDLTDMLSVRELQVFRLAGRGIGTKGIAGELGVSRKTVESHKENIKRKMELPSAFALARQAALWIEAQS